MRSALVFVFTSERGNRAGGIGGVVLATAFSRCETQWRRGDTSRFREINGAQTDALSAFPASFLLAASFLVTVPCVEKRTFTVSSHELNTSLTVMGRARERHLYSLRRNGRVRETRSSSLKYVKCKIRSIENERKSTGIIYACSCGVTRYRKSNLPAFVSRGSGSAQAANYNSDRRQMLNRPRR